MPLTKKEKERLDAIEARLNRQEAIERSKNIWEGATKNINNNSRAILSLAQKVADQYPELFTHRFFIDFSWSNKSTLYSKLTMKANNEMIYFGRKDIKWL